MNKNPEVLYEITLKCNKNCKYCGSKNVLNDCDELLINKVKIAKEIASVNPSEVTITGGEPSVDVKLQDVLGVFNSKKIKCKVLTNGNLFTLSNFKDLDRKIYWYGYSINDLNDIEFCKNHYNVVPFNKTTMVTNFGTHNIELFDKLAKIATQFECWQVQLTMGNEFALDLDDIKELYKKFDKFGESGLVKIVKADNLVCGQCKAGIHGFSVCLNGDVVPCLSYRSWKKDMDVQGNVLKEGAKYIWKNCFKFYRNRKFFPCCKDITGVNRLDDLVEAVKKLKVELKEQKNPQVFVYGIVTPKNTPIVYGVTDWNTPLVYGVDDGNSLT